MFFQPAPRPHRAYDLARERWPRRRSSARDGAYRPAEAMRRPRAFTDPAPPARAAGEAISAPPAGVVALNRAAFGPRPGDLAAFAALGADDTARLTAWVDRQLDPGSIDDAACDAQVAASGFTTQSKTPAQLWADHHVADPDWIVRLQPALEAELLHWTRAVHTERQLLEAMVHFWHNHFNVYAYEFLEGPTWGQYDRLVVRPNALGNFRTLVEAVAKSPAMLTYLDNFINFAEDHAGYSNENYARELLELHTLGATVSYGKTPRAEVPVGGDGSPLGYCEDDVQDAARALTGWSFDLDWISWEWGGGNSGQFVYVDALHSTEPKTILGVAMPAGRTAQQDGQQALDIVCSHPACGTFLARKLLRRFVCDFPDTTCPALLVSTAALWTSLWQDSQQIAKVVRHVLLSTEFRTIWGEKVKRPFEVAVSALRAGAIDFRFYQDVENYWGTTDPDAEDTHVLHWLYDGSGQEIFGWPPPNGHADVRSAWQSANPRVALWRVVNWLIDVENGSEEHRFDALGQTPPGVRSANALVDFWVERLLGRPLSAAARAELVDFVAQGFHPDFDLPLDSNAWPYYWQDRLRALAGLVFMTPDFLWR
jgi:uncharacterized protein (DUF1800 family)